MNKIYAEWHNKAYFHYDSDYLPWSIGHLSLTNTSFKVSLLFQLGDVELTKAWLSDLATLGHKIPTFDQPVKEEELSCAEKS